jgi:hypothetical protein
VDDRPNVGFVDNPDEKANPLQVAGLAKIKSKRSNGKWEKKRQTHKRHSGGHPFGGMSQVNKDMMGTNIGLVEIVAASQEKWYRDRQGIW